MVIKSLAKPGVSLITAATVLLSSCNRASGEQTILKVESTYLFDVHSGCPVDSVDVFIYSDEGTRQLDSYCRLPSAGGLRLRTDPGDKTFVLLANVPGSIDTRLLGRMDAMERLTMRYASERSDAPLLSGIRHSSQGTAGCVRLTPLLCPVHIRNVVSRLDAPVDAPIVCLRGVNASAEVLRNDGFRPTETMDRPEGMLDASLMLQELPFAIVNSPGDAGITLRCYPNSIPDATGGALPTSVCIAGKLRGRPCLFETELPPLERGDTLAVDLSIESDGTLAASVTK